MNGEYSERSIAVHQFADEDARKGRVEDAVRTLLNASFYLGTPLKRNTLRTLLSEIRDGQLDAWKRALKKAIETEDK